MIIGCGASPFPHQPCAEDLRLRRKLAALVSDAAALQVWAFDRAPSGESEIESSAVIHSASRRLGGGEGWGAVRNADIQGNRTDLAVGRRQDPPAWTPALQSVCPSGAQKGEQVRLVQRFRMPPAGILPAATAFGGGDG